MRLILQKESLYHETYNTKGISISWDVYCKRNLYIVRRILQKESLYRETFTTNGISISWDVCYKSNLYENANRFFQGFRKLNYWMFNETYWDGSISLVSERGKFLWMSCPLISGGPLFMSGGEPYHGGKYFFYYTFLCTYA